MKPFDFVNSINSTKKNLMKGTENDALAEKTYSPWLTNRSLSYFADSIHAANMMNCNHSLDNKLQYSFLINIIRPSKRFAKWVKKEKDEDLEAVAEYYGYNRRAAKAALDILSSEHIKIIKKKIQKGET